MGFKLCARNCRRAWLVAAAIGALALLGLGQPTTALAQQAFVPPPPLNATSWLLADANSGLILAEHHADLPLPLASLTKIMTGYVVADQISRGQANMDDTVTVSHNAYSIGGSRMFLESGSRVDVRDLINGLVVHSGNDASVALAEYAAGSEQGFVVLMNQHAQALGLKDTFFQNATGLPAEDHQSTAKDLYVLTRALIQNFPQHYRLYAKKEFSYGVDRRTGEPIRQRNRNRMLWEDSSVDGVKTGHTEEAGYCLVVSAKRGDMRLISVVMGAPDEEARLEATRKLLSYGYRFFVSQLILEAGKAVQPEPKLWGGEQKTLDIGIAQPAWVTIPRGEKESLVPELQLHKSGFWAPIRKGDEVGILRTTLHGRVLHEAPLVALEDVAEGGLWGRLFDRTVFFLSGVIGNLRR